MRVAVGWSDIEGLRRFDNALKSLGEKKMRQVANRALNAAGGQGRTQVVRALAKQTGLTQKVVKRYIKVKQSDWGSLEYRINSNSRDVPLKYFKPKEVDGGTNASPFGKKTFYQDAFFRGGRFPDRRVALSGKMNGHVFVRKDTKGRKIMKAKSGVNVSEQMVKDASAAAWRSTIGRVLPVKLEDQIEQATNGVFS
ncbi:phage tail protein [Roseibium alexandrii]|uniref:phage tail protein n=1 Tax=Roseibium alexandrii TaxID=388408 RepID=UPI0037520387